MSQKIHSIFEGDGTPLLFQHGLTANVTQIKSLLGGLPDIRLISIDCPGHGLSHLEEGYALSFDSYADEVIRNMDSLRIEKGVFGGISMGSGIALNIALRHPDRVLGLVLVRPAWLDVGNPENLSILLDAIPFMRSAEGKVEFQKLPAFKKIEEQVPLAAKSVLGVFGPDQQAILTEVIRRMVSDHPIKNLQQLESIDCPSLIIGNDNDPLHPYDMAEVISRNIENSQIRKVVSGYINKLQHRHDVRELVQVFIKNITTIK